MSARTATVGVIGMGYVGLPLCAALAKHFATIGFDVDARRVAEINDGRSYIGDVEASEIAELVRREAPRATGPGLWATTDFDRLKDCDVVIICVPTPLEKSKAPDVSYILSAAKEIAKRLRPGQLIVLESTTYPGTTDEVLLPLLCETGLKPERDFLLAFSPERVDPGNRDFRTANIPKIVGGCSPDATQAACALYATIVEAVHPVSSARVAECAKLWENTFRAVNIAMANEMSLLCYGLGISTIEVINAAKTKPFGFMAFYPGPGVGGHCIPLDPHYLSWKSQQHGYRPRFIQLADDINSAMPDHVVEMIADALNGEAKALRGARILVLGVAYKSDVVDIRQSPAIEIIGVLQNKGADVSYHDPNVPRLDIDPEEFPMRSDAKVGSVRPRRPRPKPLESVELDDERLREADCVVLLTAHSGFPYKRIMASAALIVDTRNVFTPNGGARVVSL